MAMADESWREYAACVGRTALFFPPVEHQPRTSVCWDKARRICAGCPVLDDCRDYALANPKLDGFWAGMTVDERRIARTGRRRTLTTH